MCSINTQSKEAYMILGILTFLITFFSLFHIICALKYKDEFYDKNLTEKGFSIIVPCYNEAPILKYTIEGLNQLRYSNYEVIFVNDGSKDDTLKILCEELYLNKITPDNLAIITSRVKGIYQSKKNPNMYVIDKENGGKADSLNIGFKLASNELILTMDGDSILDENALKVMNHTFYDESVIASGGAVHVMQLFKLNKKPSLLILLQSLDFIKGFYVYKASLAFNNALAIISGAFGVFRKEVLYQVGGFRSGLGEDIDITLRFQEYGKANNKKIVFTEQAICYTECPERLSDLIKQRVRWQKGFIDSILKNRSYIFKNLLKNSVSFFLIIDAVTINTLAIIVLAINIILISTNLMNGSPSHIILYIAMIILFNTIYSMVAIKKAKYYLKNLRTTPLYFIMFLDMLLFRLLYVYVFIKGSLTFYFTRINWDKLTRTNNSYNL